MGSSLARFNVRLGPLEQSLRRASGWVSSAAPSSSTSSPKPYPWSPRLAAATLQVSTRATLLTTEKFSLAFQVTALQATLRVTSIGENIARLRCIIPTQSRCPDKPHVRPLCHSSRPAPPPLSCTAESSRTISQSQGQLWWSEWL